MKGCKPTIWKILSVGAALALTPPGPALGEFRVCPTYSKTFGPDDTTVDNEAFVNDVNVRPGGEPVKPSPDENSFKLSYEFTEGLCVEG